MLKIEMHTNIEVVCPCREGEVDKYNVYVEYVADPTVERLSTTDFSDILQRYADLDDGISAEDLAHAVYIDIDERYVVDKLDVYVNTPYDLPEDEQPDVILYAHMSNAVEGSRA